jgi:hemerythrin superfamily protein
MTFHHARLEAIGRHVLSILRLEGAQAAQESWQAFKEELFAHFEAEENWMLPGFARTKSVVADSVRADHDRLRGIASSLVLRVDTRAADEAKLRDLLAALATHLRAEEADLYPWSETAVREPESREVLRKVEAAELAHPALATHPHASEGLRSDATHHR